MNAHHDRSATVRPGETGRFWFERPHDDLPFYNGKPVSLSAGQWVVLMLAVAAGFGVLILPLPALHTALAGFAPSILFFAIPLTTLAIVAPKGWASLFRKLYPRDVAWMFGFALLNIVVTMLIGYLVKTLLGANANPLIHGLLGMSGADLVLTFARTAPQLFGEEVLTILPFLAMTTLLHGKVGLSRRWSIALAWLVSAAMFGALHLPTYGWNLVQCMLIIGSARLILTLPYLMTKNIWVSTGAHIINDWALFGGAMALARFL